MKKIILSLAMVLSTSAFAQEQGLTLEELAFEPSIAQSLNVAELENGYLDISWQTLVPKGWVEPPPEPIDWNLSDEELFEQAMLPKQVMGPTVAELEGQKVRLPGFIVPLEMNEQGVTEFLFVPFVGACVHVPPPPSNQLLFVQSAEPVPLEDMWTPVFAFGTLTTALKEHEMGNASYHMQLDKLEEYREF